ncbi:MAG: oxidoreductase [Armatimonadetes bacterium 13_1_40CM_64_14]|nr:MAG: oxidoreductase [Armatimonadetes bacterium 13_1_40CM_64_14]
MERRAFGWMSTLVPVIGQGTWDMEGNRKASIAALRRGMDLGMTHIDTAEMYGNGAVEEIVGEALEGRRAEAFVVSKVLPQNASRAGTIAACERSLRRLRMDSLDVYLLHSPSRHPLAETIAAFEDLVRAGKTTAWGVSNFNTKALEDAVRVAGATRIACNQVLYYLEDRAVEQELMPACARHRIALVGYSPFGQGRFRTHRVLEDIARAHGATARQVALRFLVRDPNAFTIPKSSTVKHVEENAGAGSLELTEEEIQRIAAAFPPRRPH